MINGSLKNLFPKDQIPVRVVTINADEIAETLCLSNSAILHFDKGINSNSQEIDPVRPNIMNPKPEIMNVNKRVEKKSPLLI